MLNLFQFTHPVGVRHLFRLLPLLPPRFNSRTPCGVRQHHRRKGVACAVVSIHAPRVGCDLAAKSHKISYKTFQFTHPVWGATGSG